MDWGFAQVLAWLETYGGVTSFQLVPKEAGQRSQAIISEYAGPAATAAALKRLSEVKVSRGSICTHVQACLPCFANTAQYPLMGNASPAHKPAVAQSPGSCEYEY